MGVFSQGPFMIPNPEELILIGPKLGMMTRVRAFLGGRETCWALLQSYTDSHLPVK